MGECIRIHKDDTYLFTYVLKWSNGTPIDLSGVQGVELVLINDSTGTEALRRSMTVGQNGSVSYAWGTTGDPAVPETHAIGMYQVRFEITDGAGKVLTVPTGEIQWLWITG